MWGFRDEVQKPELQAICKLEHLGTKDAKTPDEAAAVATALLAQYPKLHGLFVQHTSPAQVVAAVKKSGRKDVWVGTWGLNVANAKMLLEGGPLWSLGNVVTSPNKACGAMLVDAVAKWHLGHDLPLFIFYNKGSVAVTADNLEAAWRQQFAGTADGTPPWVKGKEWVDFLKTVGRA